MNRLKWLSIGIMVGLFMLSSDSLVAKGNDKIGIIDVKRVFDEYDKKKEYDQLLEQSVKGKETQVATEEDEINRLKEELEIKSEKEKLKKQEEIDERMRKLADFKRSAQRELDRENDKLVREIVLEIDEVIKEYGEKGGYEFILRSSSIIYGNEGMDITDEIVKILNEKYNNKRDKK